MPLLRMIKAAERSRAVWVDLISALTGSRALLQYQVVHPNLANQFFHAQKQQHKMTPLP